MKTFVVGDIHGAYKALRQCLELSQFDKRQDRLICLGDVCDRGLQVKECIDELLTIPQCVYILGNHDLWSLEWALEGKAPGEWLEQGGMQTVMSYKDGMPKAHIQFLSQAPLWFLENNRLFVHGGFDPQKTLAETPREIFIWDRSLLKKAYELHQTSPQERFGDYDEIYVGHTPTIKFGKTGPQQFCNIWAIDTGAGAGARLTIMDVDRKKYWQSDPVAIQ